MTDIKSHTGEMVEPRNLDTISNSATWFMVISVNDDKTINICNKELHVYEDVDLTTNNFNLLCRPIRVGDEVEILFEVGDGAEGKVVEIIDNWVCCEYEWDGRTCTCSRIVPSSLLRHLNPALRDSPLYNGKEI